MSKPLKIQLHNQKFKIWNYRGTSNFSAFAPVNILAMDSWSCNATENVYLDNGTLIIRPGDMVIAAVDNPGSLSTSNINASKWIIIRHITNDELQSLINLNTSPGQTIRATSEFEVRAGEQGPPANNYNPVTNILHIGITLVANDNINIYVNGLKYSNTGPDNAIDYAPGNSYVTWIPINVGFDLLTGDMIEIEVFNT